MKENRFIAIDQFDNPPVLDCSVTNIPGSGSSTLQVVSSMASIAEEVYFIDSTDEFIGIYKGGAGNETLIGVIGGNKKNQTPLFSQLAKGDRVSIRNMSTNAISTGGLYVAFLAPVSHQNHF